MKIVSFNIRCDYEQDGANNFCYRRNLILEKIEQTQPDIIGFQEVLPHVQKWLREHLTDYMVVGCGRETDLTDEHMTIAIKRNHIDLYELHTFWLSNTPQTAGSRYKEQSICPRIYTKAIMKEENTKTPICIYNTHLDHEGELARRLGLNQVLKQMKEDYEKTKYPMILMGDFNAEPNSPELEGLRKGFGLYLTDTAKELGITFHDYGNKEEECKIDYLLVGKEFTIQKAELWKDCKNGVYLSDHYPVYAEIELF